MMVMTTKVNMKKIVTVLAAAAAVILAAVLLFGKHGDTQPTAAEVSDNDSRVRFLTDQGWDVVTSPRETSQVIIPQKPSEVYRRYNALQKSQGYDLTEFSGKNVMRYVYEVRNFPGATAPVYATLLIYKGNIIGGDITDTSAKGAIQSLKKAEPSAPPQTSEPAESTEAPAETEISST